MSYQIGDLDLNELCRNGYQLIGKGRWMSLNLRRPKGSTKAGKKPDQPSDADVSAK
jgi:hypothetical protein